MAIIKKGILGTPKGKIGNLMGYQRRGTGVLQSVPTVTNAPKRRYNLHRRFILLELIRIWDNMIPTQLAQWALFNNTSSSDMDFFLSFNMNISDANFNVNLNGLWEIPPFNTSPIAYVNTYNASNKISSLQLIDNSINSHGDFPNALICLVFDIDGTFDFISSTPFVLDKVIYEVDLSGDILPTSNFIVHYPVYTTPTANAQRLMADITILRV